MMDDFDAESELARLKGSQTGKQPIAAKGSKRTAAREAFFQVFAERAHLAIAKSNSQMRVILTGGLRTRAGMASPVMRGIVDGVALGRLACVYPDAPRILLDRSIPDNNKDCSPPAYVVTGSAGVAWLPLKLVNAGWTT
jgi:2,4-dienoyl-CoA reductase-like NADH-dependent reductase (Old Yellow Enzyme family)